MQEDMSVGKDFGGHRSITDMEYCGSRTTLPRYFAYLFAMSSAQSSADPYNPDALPKKAPPPLRTPVKSHPPTLPGKQSLPMMVIVYQMQAPPAVFKKAPPPLRAPVKLPPPTLPGKQPPPILVDGIQMQAPPTVVKRAPPPRSNHKPNSPPRVTVEAENAQPAPPLRALPHKAPAQQAPSLKALPREAPALKAPPPKLSSETN